MESLSSLHKGQKEPSFWVLLSPAWTPVGDKGPPLGLYGGNKGVLLALPGENEPAFRPNSAPVDLYLPRRTPPSGENRTLRRQRGGLFSLHHGNPGSSSCLGGLFLVYGPLFLSFLSTNHGHPLKLLLHSL